ncbi:MAG: YegP family protein [Bacteroidota bacterium]
MFEIFQSEKSGEFYFRLKAKNGQKILGSEGYTSKSACMNGVESVKKNAGDDGRYERKEAKNGKHHFNLKAGNGQVIGSSQMYESTSGMENGIESVMKNAAGAEVKDLTA